MKESSISNININYYYCERSNVILLLVMCNAYVMKKEVVIQKESNILLLM